MTNWKPVEKLGLTLPKKDLLDAKPWFVPFKKNNLRKNLL